jgi:hypothetical protein
MFQHSVAELPKVSSVLSGNTHLSFKKHMVRYSDTARSSEGQVLHAQGELPQQSYRAAYLHGIVS